MSPTHERPDREPSADDLQGSIAAEHSDRVNFGMQQNDAAVVQEVAITNDTDAPLHDLTVTASLDNEERDAWVGRIARINPAATYRIEPKGLSFGTSGGKRVEVAAAVDRFWRPRQRCDSQEILHDAVPLPRSFADSRGPPGKLAA